MSMGAVVGSQTGSQVGSLVNGDTDFSSGVLTGRFGMLVAGQSNADGQDAIANLTGGNVALTTPFAACRHLYQTAIKQNPIVWRYGPGGSTTPPPVVADVAPHFGAGGPNIVGPEMSASRDLDTLNPGKWAWAEFCLDGSDLETSWLQSSAYPTLPAGVDILLSQFLAFTRYAGCQWKCWYWNQGVFDGKTGLAAQAARYADNFTTFAAAVRGAIGNVPIIIDLAPSNTDPTIVPFLSVIRAQQQLCVDTIPWCTLMNHDALALLGDNLHYTADSTCTIGHDVVTAYSAAIVTTAISGSLADSPDPVTTSSALTYTLSTSNTGVNSASNVCATIVLPAGVALGSNTGTGWTFTTSGQTVFAKRATMAVGAAPNIVLNCTAPASFGSGSITCTYSIVASNAPAASTGSQTTTLALPLAYKDATLDVFIPQTQAEFTSLGLAVPDGLNTCQEASGNMADAGSSGFWVFSPTSGSPAYQATLTGVATKGITGGAGAATFGCSVAGVPAFQNNSVAWFVWMTTTGVNSTLIQASASANIDLRINATPKFAAHIGSNVVAGATNPTTPQLFCFVYDKTNSTFNAYSKDDKINITFAAQSNTLYVVQLTAALGIFGSFAYFGANAVAMTSTAVKNVFTVLGNGHYAPSWS